MFDVAIVGAGPSGSRLAQLLGKQWYSVLLVDKSDFPRNKPCWGGVAMETIAYLGYDLPEEIIEWTVYESNFFFRSNHVRKRYESPISFTVKREKFDNFLFQEALSTGKVTFLCAQISALEQTEDGCILRTNGEEYFSRILVGADGANSLVKRTLFRKKHRFDISKSAVAVAFDHCLISGSIYKSDAFYFYFGEDNGGYRWVFPNKTGEYNIGVGLFSESAHDIKNRGQNFLEFCHGKSERNMVGHTLPYGCNSGVNGDSRVLLIWDAAGLIDPFTGEGIGNAILSANIASEVIIRNWDFPMQIGKNYDRSMRFLYIDLWLLLAFSKVFHRFYSFFEKVILKNDFIIDWYVDISRGILRPKKFILRCFISFPRLLYRTYFSK